MASVHIGQFCVDYTITTGEVREFEEFVDGDYVPVTEHYAEKMAEVVFHIMHAEGFQEAGYPAFVKRIKQQNQEVKAKS